MDEQVSEKSTVDRTRARLGATGILPALSEKGARTLDGWFKPLADLEARVGGEEKKLAMYRDQKAAKELELEEAVKATDISDPKGLEALTVLQTHASLFPRSIEAQEKRIESYSAEFRSCLADVTQEIRSAIKRRLETCEREMGPVVEKYCGRAHLDNTVRSSEVHQWLRGYNLRLDELARKAASPGNGIEEMRTLVNWMKSHAKNVLLIEL